MHAPNLSAAPLPGDVVPRTVGIVGFNGVAALDIIGPLEAFKAARAYTNFHRTHSCYEVQLLGLTGKRFVAESGLDLKADKLLAKVSALDTLIIPGGAHGRPEIGREIAVWLRANAGRVRRIASVNTGVYALAEGGFLNN